MKLKEIYDYPQAGIDAPPGVKQEIEKFRNLPDKQKARKPLLYYLLGAGTPDYKMSKNDSKYTDKSEVSGRTCGNCKFAYGVVGESRFICSQISGDIKLEGWCKLWKKIT